MLVHPTHPADFKLISCGSFVEVADQTGSQGPFSGAGGAPAHRSVKIKITKRQCAGKSDFALRTIHLGIKGKSELSRPALQDNRSLFEALLQGGLFSRSVNALTGGAV